MQTLSPSARGVVEGIAQYIKREGKTETLFNKTRGLLEKVARQEGGNQVAYVESAVAVDEAEKKAVSRIVSRLTGSEVKLQCRVNPEILGGLVIKAGDWIIDTSIESQLKALTESLGV